MAIKLSYILVGSLAVNAALLGLFGGQLVGGRKPAAEMQFERYGPTSDVVAAAWAQLADADRQVLRKQLRDQWVSMEADRKQLGAAGKAVYEAAKAEPFDESRLRNALIVFQQREQMMQHQAEDVLISHLGKMPPDARATAAVGLLTPFNARAQRVDGRTASRAAHGSQQQAPGQASAVRPGPVQAPPVAAQGEQ